VAVTEYSQTLRIIASVLVGYISGVPKHSDLEPDHLLAKNDGNHVSECALNDRGLEPRNCFTPPTGDTVAVLEDFFQARHDDERVG